MISLPIPEHNSSHRSKQSSKSCPHRHVTYNDLSLRHGERVAKLAFQLSKRKIRPSDCVHLDPDIRRELRDPRSTKLPLTFGQDGSPQTELRDLRDGDLFLFFGWFRDACEFASDSYCFAREGPDVHAIWGWLQVGQRLELKSDMSMARKVANHHPHVSHPELRENNFLYVASETLSFLPHLEGAGTLNKFHEGLRLSDAQANLRPRKRLRSNWSLPAFFKHVHITHIPKLSEWPRVGENILGKAANYPGQEFVFETKGHETELAKWLDGIFRGKQRQQV
jgi:Nucleotide modification associated domain 3